MPKSGKKRKGEGLSRNARIVQETYIIPSLFLKTTQMELIAKAGGVTLNKIHKTAINDSLSRYIAKKNAYLNGVNREAGQAELRAASQALETLIEFSGNEYSQVKPAFKEALNLKYGSNKYLEDLYILAMLLKRGIDEFSGQVGDRAGKGANQPDRDLEKELCRIYAAALLSKPVIKAKLADFVQTAGGYAGYKSICGHESFVTTIHKVFRQILKAQGK